jgi:hypothetical protein
MLKQVNPVEDRRVINVATLLADLQKELVVKHQRLPVK